MFSVCPHLGGMGQSAEGWGGQSADSARGGQSVGGVSQPGGVGQSAGGGGVSQDRTTE